MQDKIIQIHGPCRFIKYNTMKYIPFFPDMTADASLTTQPTYLGSTTIEK